jgi:SHOCT-like protein
MSAEERKKILQMVADGKISATEAANLMRALDDEADADADTEEESAEAKKVEVIESRSTFSEERDASSESRQTAAPEFDQIKARAQRFALIPLWAGIFITVFSAWAIYAIQQNAGVNFWFYCMTLPMLLGVFLIVLGAGGRSARWIYVDVDRRDAKPGDGPRRITLGFPAPLGLVAWFFQNFGHNIHGMDRGKMQGIVEMINATRDSKEPLMVNVDDDNAHVQVYIG